MALKIARRGQVPPFIAMDVLRLANERAAAGDDILHLEVGQPSTPAPAGVLAAARVALARETLGYTDALGLPALREAIAAHYRRSYGVALDPARVAVTTGSSGAFLIAFLAAFDAGDRVAMAAPAYPAYRNILTALGLVPVELQAGPAQRYQMTLDLLRGHQGRLDGLIVASPANPTGTMLAPDELAAIAGACRDMGIRFVSDEIYHGIVYAKTAATALAAGDEAIVVNSFSKYFSMTGWRLGWMVVPQAYVREFDKLSQNIYLAAPTTAQHAALAAFEPATIAILEGRRAEFKARRDFLLPALRELGFRIPVVPQGAFYIYADCSGVTGDSFAFARDLLETAGVAITPGADFGANAAERHVRFAYTNAIPGLAEGVKRIGTFLART
jgi:aspartate/methionine/tyrosine aminotransferase